MLMSAQIPSTTCLPRPVPKRRLTQPTSPTPICDLAPWTIPTKTTFSIRICSWYLPCRHDEIFCPFSSLLGPVFIPFFFCVFIASRFARYDNFALSHVYSRGVGLFQPLFLWYLAFFFSFFCHFNFFYNVTMTNQQNIYESEALATGIRGIRTTGGFFHFSFPLESMANLIMLYFDTQIPGHSCMELFFGRIFSSSSLFYVCKNPSGFYIVQYDSAAACLPQPTTPTRLNHTRARLAPSIVLCIC